MLPAIEPGQRLVVNKLAYGLSNQSLAFGFGRNWDGVLEFRLFAKSPARGDAIIFWSADHQRSLVSRVVGLPGEEVSLVEGRVELNGQRIERMVVDNRTLTLRGRRPTDFTLYQESYPDGTLIEILEADDESQLDNAGPFRIPDGYVLVLGDNRDYTIDSRLPVSRGGYGLIPVSQIIGRISR